MGGVEYGDSDDEQTREVSPQYVHYSHHMYILYMFNACAQSCVLQAEGYVSDTSDGECLYCTVRNATLYLSTLQ